VSRQHPRATIPAVSYRPGTLATLAALALAASFALPASAAAATLRTGGAIEVPAGESIEGNVYLAGGAANVQGSVSGDLVIAAGTDVAVSGAVGGDLTVFSYNADIAGTVAGDLRVAGGLVVVSGQIGGDLVAAGGRVLVLPGASIGGDLYAAGGELLMRGTTTGGVRVLASEAEVGGSQGGGSVTARAVRVLGEARGAGLAVYAPVQTIVEDGASLASLSYNKIPPLSELGPVKRAALTFLTLWRFLSFASTLVLALALAYGAKVFTQEAALTGGRTVGSFFASAAAGALTFIVLPLVSVLAAASIFALPIGILGFLATAALLVVAPALGALAVGLAVERGIRRGADVTVSYRAAALGAVVLALIGLVPIGGSVVKIIAALAGAGAAARVAARRLRGDSWSIEKVLAKWSGSPENK
jgi:hypothetical protein